MIAEALGLLMWNPLFANDVLGALFNKGLEQTLNAVDQVNQVRNENKSKRDQLSDAKTRATEKYLCRIENLPKFDDPSFYNCVANVEEDTHSFIDWNEVKEGFTSFEEAKDDNGNQNPRSTDNGWIFTEAYGPEAWRVVQASVHNNEATLTIATRSDGDDWLATKVVLERNRKGDAFPCAMYFVGQAWRSKNKKFSDSLFGVSDEKVRDILYDYFAQAKAVLFDHLKSIDKPELATSDTNVVADLNKLCEMREKGLLTAEEFKQAKQKLLDFGRESTPLSTSGNVANDLARARGAPRITLDNSALICSTCGSNHGLRSDWHLKVINCDCGALINVASGEVSSSGQLKTVASSTDLLYDVWVTGIGSFKITDESTVEVGKLIDPTQQHLFLDSLKQNLTQLKGGGRTQVLITTKISDAQSQKSRLRLEELGLIVKVERNYSE